MRVDEEPQKQGNTPKPRQGKATRCGKVQGTQEIIPSSCNMGGWSDSVASYKVVVIS